MSDSSLHFDISTPEGRRQLLRECDLPRELDQLLRELDQPVYIGAVHYLARGISSLFMPTTTNEIEAQRKTAIEIIQAGNANNVEEVEITM